MSKSKWTQVIKFSLSAILCALLTISITDQTVAQPIDNCTDNTGIQLGICINTDNDSLTVLAQQQKQIKSSGQPSSGGGSSTLDDQRAQKTADAKANPVSGSYKDRCKELFIGKAANSPIVSDDTTIVRCELPPDPEGGPNQDPGRVPTTRDILYLASTVIHADGAGLYKRPLGVSYTNKFIPTIVAVTSPTQTHVINLLGRDITITLTATNYEWNWGDGTPNLVTTSCSAGLPGHPDRTPRDT